ncbi:hypothetical protein [Pseudoflavonifractor capillosus]|uniref:hypothetical protein n=1 Tax=Pseudoflavonifractor capillosus TaxID=106588 RepID=UPI00195771D1|nr:hypothetical protein [Pseudoflavonifractor capillosus]MBM6681201.1 hypothetical protein [Pseudoflavonifractor capillosus]
MKTVAVIFGFIVLVYLVAWLSSLDLLTLIGVLLLIAAAAVGLGVLVVHCREVQKQRDRMEEKLDGIISQMEEWERLKK